MNKTYKSKIGLEILFIPILVLGSFLTIMILQQIWFGVIVCVPIILFLVSIYFQTFYTITDNGHLIIKCGYFYSLDIEIDKIEKVKKSTKLTNAPALSSDRFEIKYLDKKVLVSPQNKEGFLEDLRQYNTQI